MEDLFMYPGKDADGYYIPVQFKNTLVFGATGNGKTNMVNSILMRLIWEYRPDKVNFCIWSNHGMGDAWSTTMNDLRDRNRQLRHCVFVGGANSKIMSSVSLNDYLDTVEGIIQDREGLVAKDVNSNLKDLAFVGQKSISKFSKLLIVVDDLHMEMNINKLASLMRRGESVQVYFLITTQDSAVLESIIPSLCYNRFAFECGTQLQKTVTGDRLAIRRLRRGFCYFNTLSNISAGKKSVVLKIPFAPDTVVTKFVNSFAVRIQDEEGQQDVQ